jgi:ABC-type iron transport system FetAB permease component
VSPIIDLSVGQLAMALLLVAAIVVVSIRQSLGLERDLVVGTVRAIVQPTWLVSSLPRCSRPHVGIGSS